MGVLGEGASNWGLVFLGTLKLSISVNFFLQKNILGYLGGEVVFNSKPANHTTDPPPRPRPSKPDPTDPGFIYGGFTEEGHNEMPLQLTIEII